MGNNTWPTLGEKREERTLLACIYGRGGSGEDLNPLPSKIDGVSFYALDLRE